MIFSFLTNIKNKISATTQHIYSTILQKKTLSAEEEETLEDLLISYDFSFDMVETILDNIKSSSNKKTILQIIQEYLYEYLQPAEKEFTITDQTSIIICGTNGSGKTTFIPKLAHAFPDKQFILAPCDTFRAAAQEQLARWSSDNTRAVSGIENLKKPSAIAFQAIEQMKTGPYNATIIDTAGRLANNDNLMSELKKIHTIADKQSPHLYTLLVLDGSSGQNVIIQIEEYKKYIPIDGIVITKLDTSAKGGAAIFYAISKQIPIYYISHGESKETLMRFSAKAYTDKIIESLKTDYDKERRDIQTIDSTE